MGIAVAGASIAACGGSGGDADAATDTADTVTVDGSTGGPTGGLPERPGGVGGPGGSGGEVTAIDDAALTVESQGRDGTTTTLTVETSADTTVTATRNGTIADLLVGDTVVAIGETVDDEFVATMITEGAGALGGGAGFPGGTPGERPEFPGGSIPDGSLPNPPEGFPEGFPDGAPIGEPGERGAGQGPGPGGGGFLTGTITDIGDSTVTIEADDGTETVVHVGEDATVTITTDEQLSDIQVGSTIRVSGETTDDIVAATSIVILSD